VKESGTQDGRQSSRGYFSLVGQWVWKWELAFFHFLFPWCALRKEKEKSKKARKQKSKKAKKQKSKKAKKQKKNKK
jgi:hypothetical protein